MAILHSDPKTALHTISILTLGVLSVACSGENPYNDQSFVGPDGDITAEDEFSQNEAAASLDSFEYNTNMVGFRDGVMSQLNNCGVSYSSSGRYLWGLGNLTANVHPTGVVVKDFYSAGEGILAVTEDGNARFSPDGKNLTGGGATRTLGKFTSATAFGNQIFLVKTDRVFGDSIRGRSPSFKQRHNVTVITDPGTDRESKTSATLTAADKNSIEVIGVVDGRIYFKELANGKSLRIASADTVQDFSSRIGSYRELHTVSMRTIPPTAKKRIKEVKRILPYAGGLVAFGPTWLTRSTSLDNVFAGESSRDLYTGSRRISSVLPRGGNEDAQGRPLGLTVAFTDGHVYWNANGRNVAGGSGTKTITHPITDDAVRLQLQAYLDNRSLDPAHDGHVVVDKVETALINYRDSHKFAEHFFFGAPSSKAHSSVSGFVSDFSGTPTAVRLYDKGWSSWEYKWRDKGIQEGNVDFETENSFIGKPGIKMVAEKGCTLFVGVSTKTENVVPFTKTWNMDPDGSLSSPQALPWDLAQVEWKYEQYFPRWLMESVLGSMFKGALNALTDASGNDVYGVPVSQMQPPAPKPTPPPAPRPPSKSCEEICKGHGQCMAFTPECQGRSTTATPPKTAPPPPAPTPPSPGGSGACWNICKGHGQCMAFTPECQ